jgi:anti-sigma-K factor RskA
MTIPQRHEPWLELVAGHVLHALEPDEEQALADHARTCPTCRQELARLAKAATALPALAGDEVPPTAVWERIQAGIHAGTEAGTEAGIHAGTEAGTEAGIEAGSAAGAPAGSPSGSRVGTPPTAGQPGQPGQLRASAEPPVHLPGPRHASHWRAFVSSPRVLATAAAIVAVAAVGIGVTALHDRSAPPQTPTVAAGCVNEPNDCIPLVAKGSHEVVASVYVHDGKAYVSSDQMSAPPKGEQYVLWQLASTTGPRPVGGFTVGANGAHFVLVGDLPAPAENDLQFAVTQETGVPPVPTHAPMAVSDVS